MHFTPDPSTPCFFTAPKVAVRVTNPQTVHQCDSFMRVCEGLSTAPSPGEHVINICPMNELIGLFPFSEEETSSSS